MELDCIFVILFFWYKRWVFCRWRDSCDFMRFFYLSKLICEVLRSLFFKNNKCFYVYLLLKEDVSGNIWGGNLYSLFLCYVW